MTAGLLADFVRADRERGLGTYGISVQRDGEPPVEHRFRSDDRVNLYSVSKGFTAVALGLAQAEGRLSLDDPLLDHFPELRPVAEPFVAAAAGRRTRNPLQLHRFRSVRGRSRAGQGDRRERA